MHGWTLPSVIPRLIHTLNKQPQADAAVQFLCALAAFYMLANRGGVFSLSDTSMSSMSRRSVAMVALPDTMDTDLSCLCSSHWYMKD